MAKKTKKSKKSSFWSNKANKDAFKKYLFALVSLVLIGALCIAGAHVVQTNGFTVDVRTESFEVEDGTITYKIYQPSTATEKNPAPAVLLLHGYQNDHETCAAYAIELARRGVVVMAIDEYGHGTTSIGMTARGYVNHKVTVNYGNDVDGESFVAISDGSQIRYKILMNFSNLSFFKEKYSTDEDGNSIEDSSMGGIAAYAYLSRLSYVDPTNMAISGHSMGTWASWSVAAAYSDAVLTDADGNPVLDDEGNQIDITPKATVLQCGELFTDEVYDAETIHFNNVLLLQAKYDEFSYFRDYEDVVSDELMVSDLRLNFLGLSVAEAEDAAFNTTYGSFDEGTARRVELLYTNHRLTTHDPNGMAAALDWFKSALGFSTTLESSDQIFMLKEWLVFGALLVCLFALLPLMELLLILPFFNKIRTALPSASGIKSKKGWIGGALLTIGIAAITYPFMTQLGHGLLPLPENIFRMTIGNGFVSWYGILILIMLGFTIVAIVKTKKKGEVVSWHDMGLSTADKPNKFGWGTFFRSLILVALMCGFYYLLIFLSETLCQLDFRFIWPFFKTFTAERLVQFLVYIPIFILFYVLNNSKIFAGMRTEGTYQSGLKGYLSCWWRYALVMVGGILVVILIEYIPFFLDIAPGADLFFGSTFGGPFMSLLIVFAPQVLVYSFLCTYIYRRTGNIYTGAILVAVLSCWIVTGGSAML